jgi:hypothetical protein
MAPLDRLRVIPRVSTDERNRRPTRPDELNPMLFGGVSLADSHRDPFISRARSPQP